MRDPAADVARVQDEGIGQATDPEVIAWAAAHNRIILTHELRTFTHFLRQRLLRGEHSAGVFVISNRLSVGSVINDLLTAHHCTDMDEWIDVAEHLPF